jgi:hypothetical protein
MDHEDVSKYLKFTESMRGELDINIDEHDNFFDIYKEFIQSNTRVVPGCRDGWKNSELTRDVKITNLLKQDDLWHDKIFASIFYELLISRMLHRMTSVNHDFHMFSSGNLLIFCPHTVSIGLELQRGITDYSKIDLYDISSDKLLSSELTRLSKSFLASYHHLRSIWLQTSIRKPVFRCSLLIHFLSFFKRHAHHTGVRPKLSLTGHDICICMEDNGVEERFYIVDALNREQYYYPVHDMIIEAFAGGVKVVEVKNSFGTSRDFACISQAVRACLVFSYANNPVYMIENIRDRGFDIFQQAMKMYMTRILSWVLNNSLVIRDCWRLTGHIKRSRKDVYEIGTETALIRLIKRDEDGIIHIKTFYYDLDSDGIHQALFTNNDMVATTIDNRSCITSKFFPCNSAMCMS